MTTHLVPVVPPSRPRPLAHLRKRGQLIFFVGLARNRRVTGVGAGVSEASFRSLAIFPGFYLSVLDLFFPLVFTHPVPPAEGVFMRRMQTGRDAAPEGSASSAGPPGASGDTARPNYMGPSGNGLVERMKAGETPWNQGRS